MSNILVTGAAGSIGSHIAGELVRRGHRVIVLDDLSGGFVDNVCEGAQFIQGSTHDVELVHSLFEQVRFGYVYHLAAYTAEDVPFQALQLRQQPDRRCQL